jgi:hypothetical protein
MGANLSQGQYATGGILIFGEIQVKRLVQDSANFFPQPIALPENGG